MHLRVISKRLAAAGVLAAALLAGCKKKKEPVFAVTSPNGGERWQLGSEYEIRWTPAGAGTIKIELSRDGGTSWEEIIGSTGAAAGTYPWTASGATSIDCLVQITELAGDGRVDASDAAFRISSITVSSPDGGELWAVGTAHEITWSSQAVDEVRIELSRDDGASWEEIVGSTGAAAGSYTWTVTAPASVACLVRVKDAAGDGASDASDAVFTVFNIWRVRADAPAGGDGLTWETAFAHPQDGVDAAVAGDEIWVAEGTYARRDGADTVVLSMKDGVAIYGGFAGTEDSRDQRDWVARVTTLDGEDAAWHVVMGASDATLDGFTVTRGNANGAESPNERAGGIRNVWVLNLVVTNCLFAGNSALTYGGGMYNYESTVLVALCAFETNSAEQGGGMYNYESSPDVTDCTFTGNSASYGGGMRNGSNSAPTITTCEFTGNSATYNGGAMSNSGGSSPSLTDCTFSANSSENGGGVYNNASSPTLAGCVFDGNSGVYGGAMCSLGQSSPVATGCTFSANTGDYGAAVYNQDGGAPEFTGCDFSGNQAQYDGGGMRSFSCSPLVSACTFSNNSALDDGGGLSNAQGAASTVENCTFSANSAVDGGGICNYGSSPTVTGCTFDGNSAAAAGGGGGGMGNFSGSAPAVTACHFAGNSAEFGGGMANVSTSTPSLDGCTFTENSAVSSGGGMYNQSGSSPDVTNCEFTGNSSDIGAGMCNSLSSPVVTNCTFSGNRAETHTGGIRNYSASLPVVTNCILWGDSAPEVADDATSASDVTYSDVESGPVGAGNIDTDPIFVSPGQWDDNGTPADTSDDFWVPGDYHLQGASLCIDAGTDVGAPDHDLDGIARPQGSGHDMGAYEQ